MQVYGPSESDSAVKLTPAQDPAEIEVSVVMPCLNEAETLAV